MVFKPKKKVPQNRRVDRLHSGGEMKKTRSGQKADWEGEVEKILGKLMAIDEPRSRREDLRSGAFPC